MGKSGSIINQLQEDTSAKIRVEDAPPGSDDRVISIVGDTSVNRVLSFDEETSQFVNVNAESSEYREASAAQEALVRVYERILIVAAESDGGYFAPGGIVSCRLLADTTLIGCLIGRGGMGVDKIRKDTGCKIRIFGQEKLPSCAMPTDEMVEIEGDILAIKKALIAISRRLQDCPPYEKPRMVFGRPQSGFNFNREPTLPNGHMDFSPTRTLVNETAPKSPGNFTFGGQLYGSLNAETSPSIDLRNSQGQHIIVFRILCSSDRVGGVIGKSGTIVRALENESGASISVENTSPDCDERLITITSIESPESRNSPAQKAVILVFSRSVQAGYEKGLDSPLSGTPISAKLVIPPNQMGCLLGKGGSIMADMRKVTGTVIKIVGGNQVSRCLSETDQVVLMTGEFLNVRDALYSATSRLRNHLFSNRMSSGPNNFNQHTSLSQSMSNLRLFNNNVDHPSSSGSWQSQTGAGNLFNGHYVDRKSASVKGGIELGRGGRSAIVTNTTVEITVPEEVIGSVYGQNGSNLARLRQISGAKVVVHQPGSGRNDHLLVISGTPNETQSAQSLIQAFILADQQ